MNQKLIVATELNQNILNFTEVTKTLVIEPYIKSLKQSKIINKTDTTVREENIS